MANMTTHPSPASVERARAFHDIYERLAPQFGYQTRDDTKAFDPESPNGKLMIAVCTEATAAAIESEREACAAIALAIDSGRGNEKEIAAAIRARKDDHG